MWADQNSEHFQELLIDYHNKPPWRPSLAICTSMTNKDPSSHTLNPMPLLRNKASALCKQSLETTIPSHDESHLAWDYYLVESRGELLLVRKPWYDILGNPVVRRVDTKSKELEMVRSIGNRALFLSGVRCLSINANKFQTIEGGCIYFVDPILTVGNCQASLMTIFHISDQVQNVMLDLDTMAGCSRPFTLAQAFAEYCIIRPAD